MSANLHCSVATHELLKQDAAWWASCRHLGYQVVEDDTGPVDLQDVRDCVRCGCTIARGMSIEARLAKARAAHGGLGDQEMIGTCMRALRPDPMTLRTDDSAVRTYLDAVAFEALIPESTAAIVELKAYALDCRRPDLYHDCWIALGMDDRYAYVRVSVADQQAALSRCEQVLIGMRGGL